MIKISPSILGADFSNLAGEVKKIESSGADSIHFDIMDRHFVPNLSFGPMLLKALRPLTGLDFHVHLMVDTPDVYVEECVKNGASEITVHAESSIHLHRSLSLIKSFGIKAGVAINPATSLSFYPYVQDLVDEILVMTVNPGFSGQKMIKNALCKIREAADIGNENLTINVDGGVNGENAKELIEYGANSVVMASAFFTSQNPKGLVEKIKSHRLY